MGSPPVGTGSASFRVLYYYGRLTRISSRFATMPDAKPDQADVRSTLLGLFVAGQLLFLLVANTVFAVQKYLPPPDPKDLSLGRAALQATRQLTDFGAGMTLQTQTWGMFQRFDPRS